MKSVADRLKEADVRKANGNWVVANAGTETPFVSRSDIRMLYCYQPSTGRHAYLNLGSDIIMSDEDAMAALGVT